MFKLGVATLKQSKMPAKDKQGVERGKCNTCDECDEYTPPKTGARCDYCNHTPVDHVKIIKLGSCKKCECQEYESGSKNSYTDCQYCECMASDHAGAEKLRRKRPTPSGGGPMSLSTPSSPPLADADKCKNPGCSRSCYVENGKKLDFCGRTCAGKYQAAQATAPQTSVMSLQGSNVTRSLVTHQQVTSTPPTQQPLLVQLPAPQGPSSVAGKPCAKCGLKPSNPGYKWCQSCFTESKES